jgi:undecaprenyl pyrophosphate phosphatase UppP
MIAIQLIAFGALLLYADRLPQRKGLKGATVKDGLYVGLAQVLALAPGTSRSGITITAGRYLGLDRDGAARFSTSYAPFAYYRFAAGAAILLISPPDSGQPPSR